MDAQCSKCGTVLGLAWSFCPHCGLTVHHEVQPASPPSDPEQHTTSSIPGAFGGLFLGVATASVLIIFGAMLCLTGLGAILGVPLIIAGILAPLASPLFGMGEHQGKCPSCGIHVISVTDGQDHHCPACDKEFALVDHRVAKAG